MGGQAEGVDYHTVVRFDFFRAKGRTPLHASERGWKAGDARSAFSHCQGWTELITYLKAYLIYGLDLRK